MTQRIMLDIETMSTDNSNALVLSVGAVQWAMNKREVIFMPPTRLWVLSLRDQLARGRTTMDSTIKWWQAQSGAAREHWQFPSQPPVRVDVFAHEFAKLWTPDTEAWANGIVFDLGNLASLLGVAPWKYNAAADARTIYKHTKQIRQRPAADSDGVAHDPVADCKSQIWGVWEHWPDDDLCSGAESNDPRLLVPTRRQPAVGFTPVAAVGGTPVAESANA